MISKNYWKWLDACFKYPTDVLAGGVNIGMIELNGQIAPIILGSTSNEQHMSLVSNNRLLTNLGVRVGTGENTYTSDAYCLSNDITSSIVELNVSYNSAQQGDSYDRTITVTGRNASSSDIEITELAITKTFYYNINSGQTYTVLLAIVKLDTPLTVGANDQFSITAEWAEQ